MEKLINWIVSNWLTVVALVIAIVGGIPGIIAIYQHYSSRPNIVLQLLRIDYGAFNLPEKSKEYGYILLEIEVSNEETSPIPLPPAPFNLSVKIDGQWIPFKKLVIPLSGTCLYKNKEDKSGANIDHKDLQKYRELNLGRLYGHYEAKFRNRDKYQNSSHYLLFINNKVTIGQLKKVFSCYSKENLPVKVEWQDTKGKKHDAYLVAHTMPATTDNCYKVFPGRIKYYKF